MIKSLKTKKRIQNDFTARGSSYQDTEPGDLIDDDFVDEAPSSTANAVPVVFRDDGDPLQFSNTTAGDPTVLTSDENRLSSHRLSHH